ncbi:MAG: MATE family efflux transporter [Alphaproteobacteria bacterium]|nr:MATE family efflux transporter [Alphaproteobacteria bacterium]
MTSSSDLPEAAISDTSPSKPAKFVQGSTMGHVVVMTLTGAFGLMAVFFVDLADMYFLSLLGEAEVAGAIGFAGAVVFINLSIGIGIAITSSALVSRSIGAERPEAARGFAASSLLFSLLFAIVVAVCLWVGTSTILQILGAKGAALQMAEAYLRIVIPSFPVLCVGLCLSGILRGIGDAQRAMYVTLAGAITNAILDPLFIFSLDMGVEGAAAASACARVVMVLVGFYGVHTTHRFLMAPKFKHLRRDLRAILEIAVPAMLTQLATPVGNAYVTFAIAPFGDSAVSALAVVTRIVPVAFGVVFSLSGAIGPIIGQNFGAGRPNRVKASFHNALIFATCYVAATSVLLFLLREPIAAAFNASPEATILIAFFCTWVGPTWLFAGFQYVANASFNNLGKAQYSTIFNWAKSLVGMVPLVTLGTWLGAAQGGLAGLGAANIIFGLMAAFAARRLILGVFERSG